jgi:hypothetical protein
MNGDFLALLPKPVAMVSPAPGIASFTPLLATTVFAFHCAEGVMIAGDHRATAGHTIFSDTTEKILEPEAPRVVPQPLPGLQPTIFVVEDDPSVRGLVKEVLQHHDFRVIEAASGDIALAMWPN